MTSTIKSISIAHAFLRAMVIAILVKLIIMIVVDEVKMKAIMFMMMTTILVQSGFASNKVPRRQGAKWRPITHHHRPRGVCEILSSPRSWRDNYGVTASRFICHCLPGLTLSRNDVLKWNLIYFFLHPRPNNILVCTPLRYYKNPQNLKYHLFSAEDIVHTRAHISS